MLGTRCLRYHLTSRSARAIATSGRISLLYYEERILPSLLSLANSSCNITERLYCILCSRPVTLELAHPDILYWTKEDLPKQWQWTTATCDHDTSKEQYRQTPRTAHGGSGYLTIHEEYGAYES